MDKLVSAALCAVLVVELMLIVVLAYQHDTQRDKIDNLEHRIIWIEAVAQTSYPG